MSQSFIHLDVRTAYSVADGVSVAWQVVEGYHRLPSIQNNAPLVERMVLCREDKDCLMQNGASTGCA